MSISGSVRVASAIVRKRLVVRAFVRGSDERCVLSSDSGEVARYEFLRDMRSRFPRGFIVVLPVDVKFENAVADSMFR